MIIATYGSLKEGAYNHKRLLDGLKPIGHSTIDGAMYLVAKQYPALLHADDCTADNTKDVRIHEVELFDVTPEVYERIFGMEVGSGYYARVEQFNDREASFLATIYYIQPGMEGSHENVLEAYNKDTVPLAYA